MKWGSFLCRKPNEMEEMGSPSFAEGKVKLRKWGVLPLQKAK